MCKYAKEAYPQFLLFFTAKSLKDNDNGKWLYCIGGLNEFAQKFSCAIEAYGKYLASDTDAVVLFRIAHCYKSTGNMEMALEYIDKAIELAPDDLFYVQFKAELHGYRGDFDSAVAVMAKSVEAEPANPSHYYMRGEYKLMKGDFDGAVNDFTVAISLVPEVAANYLCRGRAYLMKNELGLAKNDFITCVKLDCIPEDIGSAVFAYFYLGQTGNAVEFMDRLLKFSEERFSYDAACLYSLLGDIPKSIYYLTESFIYNYDNYFRMHQDPYLENIRNSGYYKALIAEYSISCS